MFYYVIQNKYSSYGEGIRHSTSLVAYICQFTNITVINYIRKSLDTETA